MLGLIVILFVDMVMGICCYRSYCNERKWTTVPNDAVRSELSSGCTYWSRSSPASDANSTVFCWTAAEHTGSLYIPAINVQNTHGKLP